MAEKKGFWSKIFHREKPSSETVSVQDYEPTEEERKESLEKAEEIAEDIINNLWESEHLSISEKHQNILDFLENELCVSVDTEIYKDITDTDKDFARAVNYSWEKALAREGKSFLHKTGVSAGAMAAVGGTLSIFTGGFSWIAAGWGFIGSTLGRLGVKAIKAGQAIWGKEKDMNLSLARDYINYALEADKLAREYKGINDEIAKIGGKTEVNLLKQAEIAEKLISFIYDNEANPSDSRLKQIKHKKEELTSYHKKYNIAEEIVAFAGGVGISTANIIKEGAQKLAEQKMQKAAEGAISLDLDGDKIYHTVRKVGESWHYIIEKTDIGKAAEKLGEKHWEHWFHQIGLTGAQIKAHFAGVHAGKLSEEAIKQTVTKMATKELLAKTIPSVIAGGVGAYLNEESRIKKQLGFPATEEVLSDEIAKEKFQKTLGAMAKKYKKEIEDLEKEETPRDHLGEAQKGDIFVMEYGAPGHEDKVRVKITECNKTTGEMDWEIIDKRPDGTEYDSKTIKVNVSDKKERDKHNRKIIPWNLRKDYSYHEWQEIENVFKDNEETIKNLIQGKQLTFLKKTDLTLIGLENNKIYFVDELQQKKNTITVYRKEASTVIKSTIRLDKLLLVLVKPETKTAEATEEKTKDEEDEYTELMKKFKKKEQKPYKGSIWYFGADIDGIDEDNDPTTFKKGFYRMVESPDKKELKIQIAGIGDNKKFKGKIKMEEILGDKFNSVEYLVEEKLEDKETKGAQIPSSKEIKKGQKWNYQYTIGSDPDTVSQQYQVTRVDDKTGFVSLLGNHPTPPPPRITRVIDQIELAENGKYIP